MTDAQPDESSWETVQTRKKSRVRGPRKRAGSPHEEIDLKSQRPETPSEQLFNGRGLRIPIGRATSLGYYEHSYDIPEDAHVIITGLAPCIHQNLAEDLACELTDHPELSELHAAHPQAICVLRRPESSVHSSLHEDLRVFYKGHAHPVFLIKLGHRGTVTMFDITSEVSAGFYYSKQRPADMENMRKKLAEILASV